MREKILKSLFLLSSIMMGIIILGSTSFLMTNNKLTYNEYVTGFIKFFGEFLAMSAICGGVSFLFFFLIVQLYKKLFN